MHRFAQVAPTLQACHYFLNIYTVIKFLDKSRGSSDTLVQLRYQLYFQKKTGTNQTSIFTRFGLWIWLYRPLLIGWQLAQSQDVYHWDCQVDPRVFILCHSITMTVQACHYFLNKYNVIIFLDRSRGSGDTPMIGCMWTLYQSPVWCSVSLLPEQIQCGVTRCARSPSPRSSDFGAAKRALYS